MAENQTETAEQRRRHAVIQSALHTGVCAAPYDVCCWAEGVTPCAEVDLTGLAVHVALSLDDDKVIVPPATTDGSA